LVVNRNGVVQAPRFFGFDVAIRVAILRFEYAVRANVIARRYTVAFTFFVNPFFIPNPRVFVEAKEFAAYTFANRAKQPAADPRFVTDDVTVQFGLLVLGALDDEAAKQFA